MYVQFKTRQALVPAVRIASFPSQMLVVPAVMCCCAGDVCSQESDLSLAKRDGTACALPLRIYSWKRLAEVAAEPPVESHELSNHSGVVLYDVAGRCAVMGG